MCRKREVLRGLYVVSHIDGRRSCRFSVGDETKHSVKVTNLNAVDCTIGVSVRCLGSHIRTPDGTTWSEEEQTLEPGKSETFKGELRFVDGAGRSLPTHEDVELAISWKPDEDD